jgi:hypothetical protein
MAITKLNSLAIPANTVVAADLSYPLTNFSSTGIDDNADATAITINSSEYVGVGTTNPADLVTLSGSGPQPAIRLITDAGTYNGVYHRIFPAGDGTALAISADKGNSGAGSYIRLDVDDTERMRVTANGLTFNGDTAAANALDDYEEGTYSPTYGNGTQTYTSRQGVYTKIGRIVMVWVDMTLSANSNQSGATFITLPFAAASASSLGTDSTGTQRYQMGSWTPWVFDSSLSGNGLTTGWISNGNSYMTMYKWSGAHNHGHTTLPSNATGRIAGTIWYTAAH